MEWSGVVGATTTTGSTNVSVMNGYVSDGYYSSGRIDYHQLAKAIACAEEESNNMKLYKVFLIRIDNRNVTEVNVVARNQSDAFIKAFISEQIPVTAIDDFDKHAQFVCDLTEEDDD